MNRSKASILIIDSEPVWIGFARSILEGAGYVVEAVEGATAACHLLHRKAFELILMNLKQVEEKSNILQKLAKPSPYERRCIVVMSPTRLVPSRTRGVLKSGAYDCVDKPFDEDGVIEMVESVLAESCITVRGHKYEG